MIEETWLSGRPPALLDAGPVSLRRVEPDDIDHLVVAVNESLDHLRPWMPWAAHPATSESMGAFVRTSLEQWEAGLDFTYLLRRAGDDVVGACGLHGRLGPGALAIGYWVHVRHVGKGLATAAARALTAAGLALRGVERLEIHTDAANLASAAVPPKLGYGLRRVDRRAPAAPGERGELLVWALPSPPDASTAT
jgi:RimJ/RimL family protein N-acetyltransferase